MLIGRKEFTWQGANRLPLAQVAAGAIHFTWHGSTRTIAAFIKKSRIKPVRGCDEALACPWRRARLFGPAMSSPEGVSSFSHVPGHFSLRSKV